MNTANLTSRSLDLSSTRPHAPTPTPPTAPPARRGCRERDFGIGYGNSGGYASNPCYASHWGAPRFRCA